MRNELKKLNTKQLIELVKTFEHYPSVTLKDGKDYILSYLEDEACTISKKEIAEYLLNNGVVITKDNIHLYYEFMSDEDIIKYGGLLLNTVRERTNELVPHFDNQVLHYGVKSIDCKKLSLDLPRSAVYRLMIEVHGVKDTLKPINEYIKEIKESEAYKNYKPLCQTEIPDYIQLEEFKEVPRDELFSYLNKTIGKKKWRVQTERTNIHGYRLNSSDNNKIVGLMIVNPDDTKKEKTKYYIYNK